MKNIVESIRKYIEKNKISKKYIDMLENIKTEKDLKEMLLNVKNQKLYKHIESLIPKQEIHYLTYDYSIYLDIINTEKTDDEIEKIYDDIKVKREEQKGKYDIETYCADNVKNIFNLSLKLFDLIGKERAKNTEFSDLAKLLNYAKILNKKYLKYFVLSINEREFTKEKRDLIFAKCKKENISKSVFKAIEIKTNVELINKIQSLLDDIIYIKDEKIVDFYSIRKSIELIALI